MNYKEIKGDLFKVDNDYFLAHCISADAKMGAGIAVEFKRRFKLGSFQKYVTEIGGLKVGSCAMVGRVFNLVTKKVYWTKHTYETLRLALQDMKRLIIKHEIKKVAMPQIGSGLDKLNWNEVSNIVQEIFEDVDIEILVCKLQ